MQSPGRGPVRLSNKQRKQERFKQQANELFTDTLRIYLGMKNKWIQEHEIADLSPARINAIRTLYFQDYDVECPWFPSITLEDDEVEELGLEHSDEPICSLNETATEFKPEVQTQQVSEQAENDAGYESHEASGCTTPLLTEATAKLEQLQLSPIPQFTEPERLVFGEFQSGEVDALVSGIETAIATPELALDYLSSIMDHPDTNQVVNVTCAVSAEKSAVYYGDSPLADLLQCSEASLLVKSLVMKPRVLIARKILHSVRARAYKFIATASIGGFLDGNRTPALINSLCADAFLRSGKKLLNPRTKWKLVAWLLYMETEYRNNRLSKYLPPHLHPKPYIPRAPRTKFKLN